MSTIPIHSAERQPCRPPHRHAGALATLTVLSIGLAALAAPALPPVYASMTCTVGRARWQDCYIFQACARGLLRDTGIVGWDT
jgi:hypothetical protein